MACSNRGRCRKVCRGARARNISRLKWKIIRSSTKISKGIIPKGNYGGGTVMVWDRGTYYVYGEDPLGALKKGRLHLVLDGEKAKGEWALIRIRSDSEKNQWLLLKATKSIKPISKKRDDESVISGRTMKQIAEDRDAEWETDRDTPTNKSAVSNLKSRIQSALKKKSRGKKQTARKK